MALIEIDGLTTRFETDAGPIWPTRDITFAIDRGEVIGLVGESGSGKSVTAKALLGLVNPQSAIKAGEVRYEGRDLLTLPRREMQSLQARHLAMVFQDPMASLNPLMRVGDQLMRIYLAHDNSSDGKKKRRARARDRALDLLRRVRIADAETRLEQYPHQFSGGMRQRVMIAMALMCRPAFLVADEPTTALDATVELQVVGLLRDLQSELGMSMLFISHNLTVVSRLADRVMVMYAGQIVESGPAERIFGDPAHPYTRALMASMPRGTKHDGQLNPIEGEAPNLARLPQGCPFRPRCPMATMGCEAQQTLSEIAPGHTAACHRATAARPSAQERVTA